MAGGKISQQPLRKYSHQERGSVAARGLLGTLRVILRWHWLAGRAGCWDTLRFTFYFFWDSASRTDCWTCVVVCVEVGGVMFGMVAGWGCSGWWSQVFIKY